MKNTTLRQLLSALVLAITCVGSAHATLLTDGDFEALSTGQTDLNTLNTAVTGEWNVEGTNQVVGADAGVTPFGNQMLRFDQTGGGNAQTQQYVGGTFLAGSTVDFSVELNGSAAGTTGGIFYNAFTGFGGTLIQSVSQLFALDGDASTWENLSVSDILGADAGLIEVQVYFNNSGLANGVRGFMDNAVLNVTEVPGPASVLILLAGLAGLILQRGRGA